MGMFMASVAFRPEPQTDWAVIKPQIESMFKGLEGLTDNLDSDGPGYAIVSPYGDMGMFLAELPGKISTLTGGWVVFATCCDSDFAMLELYHNGKMVDKCVIGELYEEFAEFEEASAPNLEIWTQLLPEGASQELLKAAFTMNGWDATGNLQMLSKATQLPIFDDKLVFGLD